MQEKLSQMEAQEVIQNAKERIIRDVFSRRTLEEIKFLALNIIKKGEYIVLYGLSLESRVHLILACSESLDLDMRDLIPVVSPLIKGKGGGRPSLVEIVGEDKENLESALEKANEFVKNKIG